MSRMKVDDWYHRGKEARYRNAPRQVDDGRVSVASRQAFYKGWDEQNHLMRPPLSAEQQQESDLVRSKLRNWVAQQRAQSSPPIS